MKLYKYQMPLPRLGICLVLISNGTLALVPMGPAPRMLELMADNTLGVFDAHGFAFIVEDEDRCEEFQWATMYNYQHFPLFKRWLQAQQLTNPFQENHAT